MIKQNSSNFLKDCVLKENTGFELYALQLANMIRIRNNDVVCIFDEVGTGKTISAGLCIIELLNSMEDYNQLNVLILTNNSVLESFGNKLKNKLSLCVDNIGEYNNKKYYIKLINCECSNIKKAKGKYDLVIIDEAHTFFNKETKKYNNLIEIASKKVIFLTATPIKSGKDDIKNYVDIACKILNKAGKKVDNGQLLDRFLWEVADPKLLSTSFDPYSPITRYFKDVTRNIIIKNYKIVKNYKTPIRLVPEVWDVKDYNSNVKREDKISRIKYLVYKISNISKYKEYGEEKYENRFIIFIDKKEQGNKIVNELKNKDFYMWSKEEKSNKKTYYQLVGGKKENPNLIDFMSSEKDANLPTVIITTWQMSEVGIDFPGYNYVVNYHINGSPSKIEQRFGRIDRMDSLHNELKMCFVIDSQYLRLEKEDECSTNNFYNAMGIYIDDLLTFLPSKNSLITEQTPKMLLDKYEQTYNKYEEYEKKFNDDEFINRINQRLDYYENNTYKCDEINAIIKEFSLNKIKKTVSNDNLKKLLLNKLIRKEKRLYTTIGNIKELNKNLKNISNKVIFNDNSSEEKGNYNIQKIEAKDCYTSIMESKRFKFFENKIIDLLK